MTLHDRFRVPPLGFARGDIRAEFRPSTELGVTLVPNSEFTSTLKTQNSTLNTPLHELALSKAEGSIIHNQLSSISAILASSACICSCCALMASISKGVSLE